MLHALFLGVRPLGQALVGADGTTEVAVVVSGELGRIFENPFQVGKRHGIVLILEVLPVEAIIAPDVTLGRLVATVLRDEGLSPHRGNQEKQDQGCGRYAEKASVWGWGTGHGKVVWIASRLVGADESGTHPNGVFCRNLYEDGVHM